MWCEGIRPKAVHSEVSDSESCSNDEGPPKKKRRRKRKLSALGEKNNRVEDIVSTLRGKHSDQYTTIQYRLWTEVIDVGTHRLGISCIHVQYCICFTLCVNALMFAPYSPIYDMICRSVDDPPGIPAFTGIRGRRTSQISALTSAETQMAQVMTPPASQSQCVTGGCLGI